MNMRGNNAHGGKPGLSDFITLIEIANEAKERAIHERIERMEKQMETLTTILHKLRNEQRGIPGRNMWGSTSGVGDKFSREFNHVTWNQFARQQNAGNGDRMAHVEEKELR